MPIIEIRQRGAESGLTKILRQGDLRDGDFQYGILADVADKTGVYKTVIEDQTIYVDMQPPESTPKRRVIALTAVRFKGHVRGVGYQGKERRVVYVGPDGNGSTPLSSYDELVVTLHSPLSQTSSET